MLAELLPIVDSFELCVASVADEMQDAAAIRDEGVNLTLKMFYTAWKNLGLNKLIRSLKPFNPEFQQAISMQ